MQTVLKKLLFLFVLLVTPFVSSNALAACQAITFSYGADGWNVNGSVGARAYSLAGDDVVKVVKYFKADATDGRYWFSDMNCTLDGSENVLIPLDGTFTVGVPVGFSPLHLYRSFSSAELASERVEQYEDGVGPATFSYNVEDRYMRDAVVICGLQYDVAICGLKSGVTPDDFINVVKTYGYNVSGNYLMNLKNSAGNYLDMIRLRDGQLVTNYYNDTSGLRRFYVFSPVNNEIVTYYVDPVGSIFVDGNRAGRVFSMPVRSDVVRPAVGGGVVVDMVASTTRPEVTTVSLFENDVYKGEQVITSPNSYLNMLCSYSQTVDLSGSLAVSHCRFNSSIKQSLYGYIEGRTYYPSHVYFPALEGVLAPGVFHLAYGIDRITAFVDYPCYKASIYGIEQRGANVGVSFNPVVYLYNKNKTWYSDSSCSTPLADDNSFDIAITKTLGVPYLYGTDASAGLKEHIVAESFEPITGLPFMCNYIDGQTVVNCTWLVDKLTANTSYYPTDYATLSSSLSSPIREIKSELQTDGSVLVILTSTVSGTCYTLSVSLGSGALINMYYDSGNKIWHARSCQGDNITADGIHVAVSGTRGVIPVTFANTSPGVTLQATIGNSYDNTTNVYVLYDAHNDSSTFTLKPTGAITANTTLYPLYNVLADNAKSLVMTYSNSKQYLKNYYQIKIVENDSMPETIFYHDGSNYYNSGYIQIVGDKFTVSLNSDVVKVPVAFQYTETASPDTKNVSNWGGNGILFCDYDSVRSLTSMYCRLPALTDTENRAYYVYSYAQLDGRSLKVVGGQNALTTYCNPLVLTSPYTERKTFYSQYYQDATANAYRIRWYSDAKCTTVLGQNLVENINYPFRLPLVQNNSVLAVPFAFNTTGASSSTIDTDYSQSNAGPIYCVYNSVENAADCMFNGVGGFSPGGLLMAPVSSLLYYGGKAAKVLSDKVLQISNTFADADNTTRITYFTPAFCSMVTLRVVGDTAYKIYYTNGAEWFADSSCKNPQGLVLPNAPEDTVILYFQSNCLTEPKIIDESNDSVSYNVLTDVPCTSSKFGVTSCNFNLSEMTTSRTYCANYFAKKCAPLDSSAGCELDVTLNGLGSLSVNYTNCCLAGYHDENGVSSTLPVGQTSCSVE